MNAKKMKIFLGLLLICLALIFVFQNSVLVDVQFLFWTLSMSGALLFILLMASGAVFGWFLRGYQVRRTRLKKKAANAKIVADSMSRVH